MNDSFLSTIAFALLGLFCLFAACLAVWIFGGHSGWAANAILLALLAIGLSYGAQHCFHFSQAFDELRASGKGDHYQVLSDEAEARGKGLQIAALVAAALASLFLWVAL